MKLIDNLDKIKTYLLEKETYSVKFKIKNMGSYVQHTSWGTKKPDAWHTTEIDVDSKNPSRSVQCKFEIDEFGKDFKATATDANGVRRIRMYYKDSPSKDKEEIELLRGKGISKNRNGKWVQDVIALPGSNDFDRNNYYYDETTGKFVNADGQEAPKSIVANFGLMEVMEDARNQVSQKFRGTNTANKTPEELEDNGIVL